MNNSTEETILEIVKGKTTWFPDKIKNILKLAEKKMPGIPEPILDEYCKNHKLDKESTMESLQEEYGLKTMDYKSSLEHEFTTIERKPKHQLIKNKPARYPYYSFFTKDKFFLPMSRKMWQGSDMDGEPRWARFVQLFNEAMNVGNIPFKAPPVCHSASSRIHYEKGEVEWAGDDVLVLILAEMRHFRDNPYIENKEWTTWEHYRDDFVQQEMEARGYAPKPATDFIEEMEE